MRVLPFLLYLNKYNGNVIAIESHSMVYINGVCQQSVLLTVVFVAINPEFEG